MGFLKKFKKSSYDISDDDDIEMGEDKADIKIDGNLDIKIIKPQSLRQALGVIDSIKEKNTVLLNLENVDAAMCRRIIDLVSGAVYALGFSIKKAPGDSYFIAPSNVNLDGHIFEPDEQIFSNI